MSINRSNIIFSIPGVFRTASRILLAALMAVAVWSCVYEDYSLPSEDDQPNVYLTLTVKVAENSALPSVSRADDNNYYFEEPLQQNEKLNELRVFIVRPDGTIEKHRKVSYNQFGIIEGLDNLTFKLKPGQKRIYLIGNESSLPDDVKNLIGDNLKDEDPFPAAELNNVVLTRAADAPFFTPEQDIPMVETFDLTLESDKGKDSSTPTYIYKTLFVTRIATKYTIYTPANYASLKIRLSHIATSQYFMPVNVVYNPTKYQPETVINGIPGRAIVSFSTPENAQTADFEIELTGKTSVTDAAGNSYYRYDSFYLMETAGTSFAINARICVTPSQMVEEEEPGGTEPGGEEGGEEGGDTQGGTEGGEESGGKEVKLKEVEISDGAQYPVSWFEQPKIFPNLPLLPRNTHVVVNLAAFGNLNCVVSVVPYRICTLDPVFGLGNLGSKDEENNETGGETGGNNEGN